MTAADEPVYSCTCKPCPHDPKKRLGSPIGMYHCPVCGEMVVAGYDHPLHNMECPYYLNEMELDEREEEA